jgi:hypothetical protein
MSAMEYQINTKKAIFILLNLFTMGMVVIIFVYNCFAFENAEHLSETSSFLIFYWLILHLPEHP